MQADAVLPTCCVWCLSRRLWEAGQKAEGQGVVGVVGAAHVKGIQARWAQAGSPETGRQVAGYCGSNTIAVPTQAGPWINLAAGTSSVSIAAAGFPFCIVVRGGEQNCCNELSYPCSFEDSN